MQYKIDGNCQYQTQAEGAACLAYLDTWLVTHALDVTAQSHTLATLDPPHAEGCVCQLTLTIYLEVANAAAGAALEAEISAQIYDGGGLGTADCDSVYGGGVVP